MPKVLVYNQQGEKVGEEKLSDQVFGVKIKPELVHQAVVTQQANARTTLAHTKGRAEVRGGGRKPWKQKGTGRARHGSIRSPLWRGGGVTFGPSRNQNFSLKINKKAKRKALAMSLTDKLADEKLIALDKLELSEIKTKKFFEILQNLKLRSKRTLKLKPVTKEQKKLDQPKAAKDKVKSVLFITDKKDEKLSRSARNIQKVTVINAASLNIVEVLKAQNLVATIAALKKIEETLAK